MGACEQQSLLDFVPRNQRHGRHCGRKAQVWGGHGTGNGQAAWKALSEKYNSYTRETRRAFHEELTNFSMEQGQDPEDFFSKIEHLWQRLDDMGETISDERFQDIILQGLPDDYRFIQDTHHRDRTFGLEEMKTTMRNMFIDTLSRRVQNAKIGGREAAMHTTTRDENGVECYGCHECGKFRRNCPNVKKNGQQKGQSSSGKGGRGQRWCSLHKTRSHDDSECRAQQDKTETKEQIVKLATVYSAHSSTSPPAEQSEQEETIGFMFTTASSSSPSMSEPPITTTT